VRALSLVQVEGTGRREGTRKARKLQPRKDKWCCGKETFGGATCTASRFSRFSRLPVPSTRTEDHLSGERIAAIGSLTRTFS
jgi:hypothetical protein